MNESNPYLAALARVPAGGTRSFAALAALAGRPSAARAAGRAVAGVPDDDPRPWHRIVDASGGFAPVAKRALVQIERLRAERARPRAGESVQAWARRARASWVGDWRRRTFLPRDDERVAAIPPERAEAFASREEAEARGFTPLAAAARSPRGGAGAASGPSAASDPEPRANRELAKRTSTKARPAQDAEHPVSRASARRSRRTGARADMEAEPSGAGLSRAPGMDARGGQALAGRLDRVDWDRVRSEVLFEGASVVANVLDDDSAELLRNLYSEDECFERTIEMAPRGYGIGRYRYLREPVPDPVLRLRARLYRELRTVASGIPGAVEYPPEVEDFFERCRAAGQERSASILLWYPRGGINHPHRDVYGAQWFPFQALVVLSERGAEFEGGAFELMEKRPDGARLARSFPLSRGDLCVFASKLHQRRESGRARWIEVEHGMSAVTRGERFALGVVMHMAE